MILLDTHALLWWSGQLSPKLSANASNAIDSALVASRIHVSTISIWEIAMLTERRRIELEVGFDAWLSEMEGNPYVDFIPIDNRIAVEANRLPEPFHRDPADRLIVATARVLGIPLITADERILSYGHIDTVW